MARKYKCSICKKRTQGEMLCQKCYDKLYPQYKIDGAWYEPKGLWARWRLWEREKQRSNPYRFLEAQKYLKQPKRKPSLSWNEVAQAITDKEEQKRIRDEWLQKHWKRMIEINNWLEALRDQDYTQYFKQLLKPETRGRKLNSDDPIYVSNSRYNNNVVNLDLSRFENFPNIRHHYIDEQGFVRLDIIYTALHPSFDEWDFITEDILKRSLNQSSMHHFIGKIYGLTDTEFNVLKLRIHQLRVIREQGSERAYSSEQAAEALSFILGKKVSSDAYRQRVTRLEKKMGLQIELWVKYRLL